jgi:hypothetical protein
MNQRLLIFRYGAYVSMEGRDFSETGPTDVWAEGAQRGGLVTRRTVGVQRGKGINAAGEEPRVSVDDSSEAQGSGVLA